MNLVFRNSLEKRTEEGQPLSAQVSICEQEGIWSVWWSELDMEGGSAQTCWFEGEKWNDMLTAFRGGLLQKMADGYAVLFDSAVLDLQSITGRSEWLQKLYYYADTMKNEVVYEELKEWRRERAAKENKASYMVATNRLLAMISAFLPRTKEELLELPGFGQYKLNMYGNELLAIAAKAVRVTTFPLDWVAERIDLVQYKLWLHRLQQSYVERDRLRKQQRSAMMDAASRGADLTALEGAAFSRREAVMLIEELEKEGQNMDAIIEAEIKQVPEAECERVYALFAQHGDRYLKPILQLLTQEELWGDVAADRSYERLRLLRLRFRRGNKEKMPEASKAG